MVMEMLDVSKRKHLIWLELIGKSVMSFLSIHPFDHVQDAPYQFFLCNFWKRKN